MHAVFFSFVALFADSDNNAVLGMFAGLWLVWSLICIALIVLSLVVNWKIAEKAGFPGAYSLLMLIPVANLIVVILFAFTEWPVTAQLRAARGGGIQPQP